MTNIAYQNLAKYFKEITILNSISALASWDNSVMMPKGGASLRQEQMVYLSNQAYQLMNNPLIEELIGKAEEEILSAWQKANITKIKRDFLHNKAIDQQLVEASTKAALACEMNWRDARANNDFKLFAQYFAQVLKLTQEISLRKAELLNLSPYDALLDSYDSGQKSANIDLIFADLESFLPSFIKEVQERQKSYQTLDFNQSFSSEKQKELGIFCMKALGFNFNNGRLDTSAHPFSSGFSPSDVRITTRYNEQDFLTGIAGILHETGHALYEQNLPQGDFSFQPVASACGMTIHESQSLFVERHIGITKEFFTWLQPHIAKEFGAGKELDPESLYKLSTKVGSSLIRVEADEVTYPAHIIMRYKLEKAMLAGDLQIADLPGAWDDEIYKLLHIRPNNYSDGCLQDIHWSWGAFGYFPTYTLGAMFAAQIDHKINQSINTKTLIKSGNFLPIIDWLKNNIHMHGSKYSSDELIFEATGSKLDPNIFKNYLKSKF